VVPGKVYRLLVKFCKKYVVECQCLGTVAKDYSATATELWLYRDTVVPVVMRWVLLQLWTSVGLLKTASLIVQRFHTIPLEGLFYNIMISFLSKHWRDFMLMRIQTWLYLIVEEESKKRESLFNRFHVCWIKDHPTVYRIKYCKVLRPLVFLLLFFLYFVPAVGSVTYDRSSGWLGCCYLWRQPEAKLENLNVLHF